MLILLPRLLNKFINTLKKRTIAPSFAMASLAIIMALGISIYPAQAMDPNYKTKLKFDANSPELIVSSDRKVEIAVGRSNNDLKLAGLSHDPASIKVLIQEYAPKYGLDWRLVYAIGYYESGNFNSSLARRQNNFFGRKARSGVWASWPTVDAAIQNQCEYLKTRYVDRGMVTPYQMNRVYAEGDTWGGRVTSIMNSL